MNPHPPMPTPTPLPTGGPVPGQKQPIKLNHVQGCLVLGAIPALFVAIFLASAFLNKPQAHGVVTLVEGELQTHLVPFGCLNTISEVAIPLRDDRKLILSDPRRDAIIPSGPIPKVTMSYIDAEKQEHPIVDCTRFESTLARGTTRFRILPQQTRIRRSDWSGILQADCALPDGRAISIALKLTDCR